MESVHLAHLTWQEAEEALRRLPVALVPLGAAAKEHGPHLPLNTDALLAEALTERVAARTPVLVVPPITYSYYPAFVEYPGSVCLNPDTCTAWLADLCHSLAAHGMKRFYVLNTGISTVRFLEPARALLRGQGLKVDFTDLPEALRQVEEQVAEQEGGSHADEIETSMMLHLAPEVVRVHLAVKDYTPRLGPGPLTRNPDSTTGVYSPTGTWGDPTLATEEKGRVVVEALVEWIVEDLRRLAAEA